MYRRILIPTDGSACSARAETKGLELAAAVGAEATLVHAVEDPLAYAAEAAPYAARLYADLIERGHAVLEEARRRAEAAGVPATTRLVEHSRAVLAILEAAEGHDLVVMGTHGRRGFDRWMFGSVAEGVLRRSEIPCLLVRVGTDAAGAALGALGDLAAEIVDGAAPAGPEGARADA